MNAGPHVRPIYTGLNSHAKPISYFWPIMGLNLASRPTNFFLGPFVQSPQKAIDILLRREPSEFKTLVSGGGGDGEAAEMNVFAGVGGGAAGKEAGTVGGGALLELTPHKLALCHLVQVFAPPPQAGVSAPALPFPFESVAHHNRLGLFLFALTRVSIASPPFPHRTPEMSLLN